MIQGGRGGEVRLKLYLSTVLLAGSVHKHPVHGRNAVANVSGPSWARSLGLAAPDTKGARRVADAQNWLHDAKFLTVDRRPGSEPIVRLLSASGDGFLWTRPTAPYIRVPIELWQKHWLWILGAKELAVLIALLDLQGGRGSQSDPQPQWMTGEERARYGLSTDTWRQATAALKSHGLLTIDEGVKARDFETARLRKTYWVDTSQLNHDALELGALAT